jgi:hypothetical protein
MTIQPTKPGSTPTAGTGRLDRNAPLSPARPADTSTSEVTSATPDKVQISDAARSLQEQLQNRLELVAQLPPGRLREVLERLNNGFYDRPEVRRAVVESIAEELNPPKAPGKR